MSSIAAVHASIGLLLWEIGAENAPRITSLTASEAQDIRKDLLEKARKIIAELYAIRNAEHLAEEGQVHTHSTYEVPLLPINDQKLRAVRCAWSEATRYI